MIAAPEAIFLYIPLMKELGMDWSEIKSTTKKELEGLLYGLSQYNKYHQFDGYDDKDISEMAKNKPEVRTGYHKYLETRRKYDDMLNVKQAHTFGGIKKRVK